MLTRTAHFEVLHVLQTLRAELDLLQTATHYAMRPLTAVACPPRGTSSPDTGSPPPAGDSGTPRE